jgi:transcriptional regulator with XRE-family HTH domain
MATAEQLQQALASRVRALRLEREWSLAELATRSGVSRAMIVQVEGARTNASLGTMCQLADALGVPVQSLIEPENPANVQVTPAANTTVMWSDDLGSSARLLTGSSTPAKVEIWEWRLGAKAEYESKAHPAGTWEILWVHRGTLEVRVGKRLFALSPGDSITFEAVDRHAYRNARATVCEFAMVVQLPATNTATRTVGKTSARR